jgi:hypothetical protein
MNKPIYVVYNPDTCQILHTSKSKGGATRIANKLTDEGQNVKVLPKMMFDANVDHKITVRNLMNGQPVEILASQAGSCCDPSTETYWSM